MAGNQRELKVISTAKNPKNPYSKDIITDPRGQWVINKNKKNGNRK